MSYLDNHLGADEKIVLRCRPSRRSYLPEYLLFFLMAVLTILPLFTTRLSGLKSTKTLSTIIMIVFYILLTISLILLIKVEYKVWSKRYALTNKRVMMSEGIFSEKFRSTVYAKVTDIGLKQTFFDKVFNTGRISMNTAGGDDIELVFEDIARPIIVKNKISELQSTIEPIINNVGPTPNHMRR